MGNDLPWRWVMYHVLLLALLALWAWFALRDRPAVHYARLYFVGAVVGFIAEFVFSGIFRFYELRVHFLESPFHDVRMAAVLDKLGNIPLIAVLYCRYCRPRPIVLALGAAILMGLVEWFFLQEGAIVYRSWHPALTVGAFVIFFLILWRMDSGAWPIPDWQHVGAFAFWQAFLVDILFHGAFWLWHYDVTLVGKPGGDSRLFALVFNLLVVGPMATAVSMVQDLRNPRGILAAVGLLLLFEWTGLVTGLIVYEGWSLWLAGLRYLAAVWLPVLYVERFLAPRIKL